MSVFDNMIDYFKDTQIQVLIGGRYYNCNRVNPVEGDVIYSDAGTVHGVSFNLIFKTSDFDAVPEQDTFVTVDGTEYKIGKITEDSQKTTFKTAMVIRYN